METVVPITVQQLSVYERIAVLNPSFADFMKLFQITEWGFQLPLAVSDLRFGDTCITYGLHTTQWGFQLALFVLDPRFGDLFTYVVSNHTVAISVSPNCLL